MRPRFYKSTSAEPSMVAVNDPADGQWCTWREVCAWIRSFKVPGCGDQLIVRFDRETSDELDGD
jgi:hypothetical protein